MSNNYEDFEEVIKNKVNKYMEQIEVPKNIGGIIMEDFEKMKNEEAEVKNYNQEVEKEKKGSKNKKALKISLAAVSAVVLLGTGVFIGSRFLGNSITTINNNGAQNSNMATNNQVFDKKVTIRKNQIENFGKLNQFLRNVHDGKEDEMEIETYLEPEWELVMSTNEPSKLYVNYDGTKYKVKYDIAEGERYSKQTIEGEFSDILIRKTTSQSSEYIEMELTFYRINNNRLEYLPVFFFQLSDVGIDPAKSSVKDLLAQDYKTYKKMNDEISNEIYDGLYNLEKDLSDKFGESVYKQKLQQLDQKDESNIINLIKDKETNVEQELVTDAFTYTGITKDGNNITVSYKIPKININSSDVTEINNEINDKVLSQAKESIKYINEGVSAGIIKINYSYWLNDDILSIVINIYDDFGGADYRVYNIDKNTGKRINNEEILKVKNMTKQQFEEKLTNAVKNKFLEEYGSLDKWPTTQDSSQSESKAMYEAQYNRTISQSNCNADTQMIYLDANGKTNVVAKVYSLAGAEAYYHIINLDDIKNIQTTETKSELTPEEKAYLTNFLNQGENNPWILLNYDEPRDLFKHSNNPTADTILRYSIVLGNYATVDNDVFDGEGGYVVSQKDMERFFKDKLSENVFTEQEIKEAFKYDYDKQKKGMYTFWVTDTSITPITIENSYKIGNTYYLKLDRGQTLTMIKDNNGNYVFYSCTGFDGKIGD